MYPHSAISGYDQSASWQQARIAADVDTLHLLESQLDQWMKQGHPFAAAFLPQIGHWPYPDGKSGNTAQELQQRGQAIVQQEDAWLGEVLDLLRKDGQLDNTIIVVFGDHGSADAFRKPGFAPWHH